MANDMNMIKSLEQARKISECINTPIFAYSDGERIVHITETEKKWMHKELSDKGYWICSIFENGHRVEA